MWYLSIIFMVFAGICNSFMDVLRYRFKKSIFSTWRFQSWVNPALSMNNKWKPTSKIGDLIMSTILVWVTDMWHFMKMLMLLFISLSIVFYVPIINYWWDIPILYFSFTGIFELFFSKILIKQNNS